MLKRTFTLEWEGGGGVTLWQGVTVCYGMTPPAHNLCVLAGYSYATKLIVRQSSYMQAFVYA